MDVIRIRDLYRNFTKYADQEVAVEGWLRTARNGKQVSFLQINDGSFFRALQVVASRDALGEQYDGFQAFGTGAAVRIEGRVVLTPDAPQPLEVNATTITLLGDCPADYPLQKKRHSFEYLRTISHLRPRTNTFSAVFRVRSLASYAIHEYFQQRDFVYVHTPLITTSDCEGAGEMFHVTTLDLKKPPLTKDGEVDYTQDFFAKQAALTVSGQLNGEAYAMALRDIYTFGPTFRAENSNTPKHAAEFWMIEPEMAFCDLFGMMDVAEGMTKHIVRTLLEKAPEEMAFFDKQIEPGLIDRLTQLVNSDFARMSYTEAIEHLQKSGKDFQFPVSWGCDLQTEHEKYLSGDVCGKPVFIYNYPKEIKSFYMRINEDGKTVAASDLLVPGVGEMVGGSQREEREDVLLKRMAEMNLSPEDYDWYLQLRRFGGVVHSGYGLGLERLLMYVTGMANIRDVIPFPRTPGNADF